MLTERKYQLLCHCAVVASTIENIAHETKLSCEQVRVVLNRLLEEGLMEEMDTGYYQATSEGRIEVRLHKESKQRLVPAPKIDKFNGVYIPAVSYQRNQGNKHIQSRGF